MLYVATAEFWQAAKNDEMLDFSNTILGKRKYIPTAFIFKACLTYVRA